MYHLLLTKHFWILTHSYSNYDHWIYIVHTEIYTCWKGQPGSYILVTCIKDAARPKLGVHDLGGIWCYTEVRVRHVTDFGDFHTYFRDFHSYSLTGCASIGAEIASPIQDYCFVFISWL